MRTDLETLLDEVRLLWHAAGRVAQRLHERERVTLGMRAVLEFVALYGASTVPVIARSRGVTRQHVQALVDALLERRLVALAPNPTHRRSVLVRLTPSGGRTIDRMQRRERRLLAGLGLDERALAFGRAVRALRAVRAGLEARR